MTSTSGYVRAFYELADMLGIPAQAASPREVWERLMKPTVAAALTNKLLDQATLEAVARVMYEAVPIASPIEGDQWAWDDMIRDKWTLPETYRRLARAALSALQPSSQRDET